MLFLFVVLLNTFRVLESTKMTIDAMREETVPLLREVKTSVEKTNREIDRVDGMLDTSAIVGASRALRTGRGGGLEPAREDHLHRAPACGRAQLQEAKPRTAASRSS